MKYGDISNTVGYTFGFRCEDFLIHYKTSTLLDKLHNMLFDKASLAEVDEEVFSAMEYIYRETEYTVDVVVEEKNYTDALKGLLDSLPFNRVVLISKPTQITSRLIVGDLTYYVDDDDYRRSLVNNQYAITLADLRQILRRRKK